MAAGREGANADDGATHARIWQAFRAAANMAPATLEHWLDSDDSRRVGWKGADGKGAVDKGAVDKSGGESVGHRSGRRIVAIKRTKKADLTNDDYAHMAKVVAYVARHGAQGPAKDRATSDWRYSLMNWGHDPLR